VDFARLAETRFKALAILKDEALEQLRTLSQSHAVLFADLLTEIEEANNARLKEAESLSKSTVQQIVKTLQKVTTEMQYQTLENKRKDKVVR
jgi:mRNA-degrading endonuclease RelE of RelBE toxin-antitoxin system